MPNRIIRESCRTSPNLGQLSDGAERLFWRLITTADDFGRFQAEHDVILGTCFPTRLDKVKITHIKTWLAELVTCQLVTTYVVNARTYAFFNTWEHHQRTRAQHSKYPAPSSDNICQHVLPDVAVFDLRPTTYDLRDTTSDSPPKGERDFDRFWTAYPKKKSRGDAEKAWKALKPTPDLVTHILTAIARAKDAADWQKDGGQFIPYPASWLRAKGWEDEEDAPREVRGEFDHLPVIDFACFMCGCKADGTETCRLAWHGMNREQVDAWREQQRQQKVAP